MNRYLCAPNVCICRTCNSIRNIVIYRFHHASFETKTNIFKIRNPLRHRQRKSMKIAWPKMNPFHIWKYSFITDRWETKKKNCLQNEIRLNSRALMNSQITIILRDVFRYKMLATVWNEHMHVQQSRSSYFHVTGHVLSTSCFSITVHIYHNVSVRWLVSLAPLFGVYRRAWSACKIWIFWFCFFFPFEMIGIQWKLFSINRMAIKMFYSEKKITFHLYRFQSEQSIDFKFVRFRCGRKLDK